MNQKISVLVPRQLQYRDIVGALVMQVCLLVQKKGEADTFGYQIISAFNEAFNNLVLHRRCPGPDGQVLVNVDITENQLIIELQDDGESFDLAASSRPSLELLRQSGMGLEIMRAFTNAVEYLPGTQGKANVLRLVRNISAAGVAQEEVE